MPKLSLVFWVPPTDWNTRSTGAPASMPRIWWVTWVSTQDWVGMAKRVMSSSSARQSSMNTGSPSPAGLMPITASPQPYNSPSNTEAAMPRASSVGWLGCRRTARCPGRPRVSRKRATTRHLRATVMRSWLRISLLTAAAISGVSPGARCASSAGPVASDSSHSRNPPTVRCATGAKASAWWVSMTSRVTSSFS